MSAENPEISKKANKIVDSHLPNDNETMNAMKGYYKLEDKDNDSLLKFIKSSKTIDLPADS